MAWDDEEYEAWRRREWYLSGMPGAPDEYRATGWTERSSAPSSGRWYRTRRQPPRPRYTYRRVRRRNWYSDR